MADNIYGDVPVDFQPQMQDISQQQKLAQMLLQQGMQQPQGQMVSGHYVKPSILQQLNPLFAAYAGSKGMETAEQKQLELAKTLRAKNTEIQQSIMDRINAGDTKGALAIASQNAEYGGKQFVAPLMGNVIPKPQESKVVPKGGVLIGPDGKTIFTNPGAAEGGNGNMGEGMFTKKGDYIAPGGVFIGKTEVAKDREIARAANDLRQGLQQLKPEDIKATETILGDVTQSGIKKYLASQLGNPALGAQAKVNTSAVMQTLQNLPPGPASDKDIMQAKSSFPGYGNAKDLQDWVDNTNALLERKINNVNSKYGSENWYGAQGIGTKQSVPQNAEDQAALTWANANPNDPRSAKIKQRLFGVK